MKNGDWNGRKNGQPGQIKSQPYHLTMAFPIFPALMLKRHFADNNLIELKLGYAYKKTSKYSDFIDKSTFNYLFLNRNSTELAGGSETTSDIETNNWQFGCRLVRRLWL
ncbi:MAG: hypothetical protein MZV64_73825 [Ignavibacteriales bacterium]|nr:hypothetical protein [Ignavibacteriales bacterium]